MAAEFMKGDTYFLKDNIFLNKVIVERPTTYHAHDFVEIAYVASGNGIHKIDKDEYKCTAGNVYLLNYDVPHQFTPQDSSTMIIYNCVFKPDFLDYKLINSRNFSDVTNNYLLKPFIGEEVVHFWDILFSGKSRGAVNEIYERMLEEFIQEEEGYIEFLRAYLIQLLILILRYIRSSSQQTRENKGEKSRIINNVMKYIENNFTDEITLDELSMRAFLSPAQFRRQFKEQAGITAKEFMQKVRIEEACRLLKSSEMKIIDIAAEIGYRDIKHFNMMFKRIMGKTPSEYKKENSIKR